MQPLWTPDQDRVADANVTRFMSFLEGRVAPAPHDFPSLYRWSVEHREDFWAAVWDFCGVVASRRYERVLEDSPKMIGARWFPGARLNFAENLLRRRDDTVALVAAREGRPTEKISYAELYRRVASLAAAMRQTGLQPGDRVAAMLPNCPAAVVAMLAATSLGAIWTSSSPDFGAEGILDRLGQVEPRLLFTADGYTYGGKAFDSLTKAARVTRDVPSIERVVVLPYLADAPELSAVPGAVLYDDFAPARQGPELSFAQLPFDHPIAILYSSGTTGLPKGIVHGAGGTLIQHLKEHTLHVDLKPGQRLFYYTTCGWMMWNWLTSALAAEATLVLYDGSPFHPDPGVLFRLAEEQGINVYGTSASYLAALERAGERPGRSHDLSRLRTLCSTGSPLSPESFRFVYREIGADINLASISGGTDLISCFALGCPVLPVYEGELQTRGLGMKVEAYDEAGNPVVGQRGELVCTASFPSMPVGFWNDPGDVRYRRAYFERYPGVWCHGDFIEITERGGLIFSGRSDSTLNPGGVRLGTAELYAALESLREVEDSIAVGHTRGGEERIILFVKLAAGISLTDDLTQRIQLTIKQRASPRHVPQRVVAVADIPVTRNGKKVELAVKDVLEGRRPANVEALANPESLALYEGVLEQ